MVWSHISLVLFSFSSRLLAQIMAGGFDSIGLMPELIRSITEMSWSLPTDVQDETIPLILGGGDVMVASETGSGKTAAFGLPMIQCVHERKRGFHASSKKKSANTGPYPVGIGDDRDGLLQVSNGVICENLNPKQWAGARATHGVRSGVYYFECTITGPPNGIPRVGWSTKAANLELGKDSHGYGYGGTAKKSSNSVFEDYGEKYGTGDTIGCLLNLTSSEISFSKNGQFLGVAFRVTTTPDTAFFPAILLKGTSVDLNFGERPFRYNYQEPVFRSMR
jgi:ATP-dependent RNA helicase DDX1